MKPKTLYLSDLDGTLLQNDATLSPCAVRELNRMIEKGLCFSISSARSTGTVIGILEGLHLTVPIALFNGVIYYDYAAAQFVRVMDIDPQAAAQVAEVMERYGLHNTMYTYHDQQLFACYTSLDTEWERQFAAERSKFPQKKWRQVQSLARTAQTERAVFFSMPGPKEKMDRLYKEMAAIPNITLSYYLDTYEPLWYLEIQAGGVDKRLSVEILRELAGADRVVAFGDNHNDLAMADGADLFCAVENATADVLARADRVIPANTADGVIRYLRELEETGGW
ncbi:MAG: HAD family hydrolase [Oscillospiraceae bacterium]|nr:HAD family hydrolase [Oscillospiraceae bacterium]